MTGNDLEEAVLEMYLSDLSGISTRKMAGITDSLSKVRPLTKDAVSRIASRLEEQQKERRERTLKEP
jgi:transposase-like protein